RLEHALRPLAIGEPLVPICGDEATSEHRAHRMKARRFLAEGGALGREHDLRRGWIVQSEDAPTGDAEFAQRTVLAGCAHQRRAKVARELGYTAKHLAHVAWAAVAGQAGRGGA